MTSEETGAGSTTTDSTTRRQLIKRAAIASGVVIWSQPIVAGVFAAPAAAQSPFCGDPPTITDATFSVTTGPNAHDYVFNISSVVVSGCAACSTITTPTSVSWTDPVNGEADLGNCSPPGYSGTPEAVVTVVCDDGQQAVCTVSTTITGLRCNQKPFTTPADPILCA